MFADNRKAEAVTVRLISATSDEALVCLSSAKSPLSFTVKDQSSNYLSPMSAEVTHVPCITILSNLTAESRTG